MFSSRGSVITNTQLLFNTTINEQSPTVQEISDTLAAAVGKGVIDPLNINPQTISVNGSGKFESKN